MMNVESEVSTYICICERIIKIKELKLDDYSRSCVKDTFEYYHGRLV